MKKSFAFFILSSVGSVFASTEDVFDFGRSDNTTDGVINVSKAYNSGDYSNPNPGTLTNLTGSYSVEFTFGNINNVTSRLSPTALESEESGWKNAFNGELPFDLGSTFSDSLTMQDAGGTAGVTLSFTGLQAGTYSLSVFGGFFGKDTMSNVSVTLSTVADLTVQSTNTTDGAWSEKTEIQANTYQFNNSGNASINHGYALTADNIVVGDDGTLTLIVKGTSGNFGRTPLNYVSLAMIPEPTTASLSLLSLGALALRRRRK